MYYIDSKAPSKAAYYCDAFGLKTAASATPNNELHRVRRAVVNPRFSLKAVLELDGIMQSKTKKLVQRIRGIISKGKPIDVHHGYRALAVDVITDCTFDKCYNQLDTPDFAVDFFNMTNALIPRGWVLQAFPTLLPLSNLVTLSMAKMLSTSLALGVGSNTPL